MSSVEIPKEKYKVTISKIVPRAHNGFRYEIKVKWHKKVNGADFECEDTTWSYTVWGGRLAAKKIIREHEIDLLRDRKEEVESYTV